MPGAGPTWITGYISLPDRTGSARLVASYVKVKPPMEGYEWGLCVWNDAKAEFEEADGTVRNLRANPVERQRGPALLYEQGVQRVGQIGSGVGEGPVEVEQDGTDATHPRAWYERCN